MAPSYHFRQPALIAAILLAGLSVISNATAAPKGWAYVSNQEGGVTVIDLDSMAASSAIDVKAKSPRGLGITPDGKWLVTANKDDGNISVIDTASGKVTRHIAVGKNPEFVRVVGEIAYVSYEPSSKGGPPQKHGQAEEDDDDDNGAQELARIAVVDLNKGKVLREITGGPETEGIEFTKDGKKLIITNEADNTITVHDIKSGKLLKTVKTAKFGERPRGIKMAPDGKSFVASLELGNKLLVLDSRFKPIRTVDTGQAPYGIAFDRTGKRLFVAAAKSKSLQVFDTATYALIKEVKTGDRCWHFTFTPDDSQLLMACGKSKEILVIDGTTLEISKRIAANDTPWGIVTYPKAIGSLDTP